LCMLGPIFYHGGMPLLLTSKKQAAMIFSLIHKVSTAKGDSSF
jgi:hypothetical protein